MTAQSGWTGVPALGGQLEDHGFEEENTGEVQRCGCIFTFCRTKTQQSAQEKRERAGYRQRAGGSEGKQNVGQAAQGTLLPRMTASVAALAMCVCEWFERKKHCVWLENFDLAASMLVAMAAAVLLGRLM